MEGLDRFHGAVRYVVSDVDDTITSRGRLLPVALEALCRLASGGRDIILLTGGSAGWADVYIRWLPVKAVIAESGAVLLRKDEDGRVRYHMHPSLTDGLRRCREELLSAIGDDILSSDQYARLNDIAVDLSLCQPERLEEVRRLAEGRGASWAQSSIHLNIWFGDYDKARGLRGFCPFMGLEWKKLLDEGCYIGDSLPDEALFAIFPISFGVASVLSKKEAFSHLPLFVAEAEGGEGFAQIADAILKEDA